jgi:hypothetical protein
MLSSFSAQCAVDDQARATQSSSVCYLHRTIKELRAENDKIRSELNALKQGLNGTSFTEELQFCKYELANRNLLIADLRDQLEVQSEAHRCCDQSTSSMLCSSI